MRNFKVNLEKSDFFFRLYSDMASLKVLLIVTGSESWMFPDLLFCFEFRRKTFSRIVYISLMFANLIFSAEENSMTFEY